MGDQVDDTDTRFAEEAELVLKILVDGHVRGGRRGHGVGLPVRLGRVNGRPFRSVIQEVA